jgi:hypothetical protein
VPEALKEEPMTVMEAVQTKSPIGLISPELFDQLIERVQEHMPVADFYAELMVEQMLAFLATVASYDPENPPPFVVDDGYEFRFLTPSEAVDPAIHNFLDFTAEYRQVCAELTAATSSTTCRWSTSPSPPASRSASRSRSCAISAGT